MPHSVVWFKRDLRVEDHAPLWQATRLGPVTCLYMIEPALWNSPDMAAQHYHFILESLDELRTALAQMGLVLHIRVGAACEILSQIHAELPFTALFSHEETGNWKSFQRDIKVRQWCRAHMIAWHESMQFGVHRGAGSRQRWKEKWLEHTLASKVVIPASPKDSGLQVTETALPSATALGLSAWDPPARQRGGLSQARRTLTSFLQDRSSQYRGGISSPLRAPSACSRISPYLSYGCISLREVYQQTQAALKDVAAQDRNHRLGLASFTSRLFWHCHFIQKLESEPEIEFRNMHRGYDGLREGSLNALHFERLQQGRTGWPMVDACVAMLRQTGWVNFRMRAMLVSVAAYPLWLDWRPVGHWLARQFLDYEPGIHWSQMQMQSGTTGINATRVYNPVKQALDHDPKGIFVRRWLPAMRHVPDSWLFEPWKMPPAMQLRCGLQPGKDLPLPVVDLDLASQRAKALIHERRSDAKVKAAQESIVRRHSSRGTLVGNSTGRRRRNTPPSRQLELEF